MASKKRKRYSVFFERNQESIKELLETYKKLLQAPAQCSPQMLIEMALYSAIVKEKTKR